MLHKIQNLLVIPKPIQKPQHHSILLPSLTIFFSIMAIALCQSIINGDTFNSNVAMAQTDDRETMGPSNENNSSTSLLSTTTTASQTQGENYGLIQKEEAAKPNRQITLVTEDAEIDIAPGKRVKAWTFNGTVPGPTIRLSEGENVTIKYINKSPIPHTIHFHGNHDDLNDGVVPQVMPNQTYLYNITGQPAGALMYHCHAPPTSLHIRMGMYGALIVDPIDKPVLPAKEFVMVMGEYSLKDQLGLEADYYVINGYADQYMHNPLQINHGELLRLYVINMGTTIPVPFHLHSATFMAYPSGIWDNEPQHVQTIPIAPGDASIIEVKWKYPGTYLFHSHGIQEERGNMGQINIVNATRVLGEEGEVKTDNKNSTMPSTPTQATNSSSLPLTTSLSMFDWQFELQKKLQRPQIINYSQEGGNASNIEKETNATSETAEMQRHGENLSLSTDKNLATSITDTNNTDTTLMSNTENQAQPEGEEGGENENGNSISIVPGSSTPSSKLFYDPTNAEVKLGTEVSWINDDSNMPHTVTSGSPDSGPSGVFDSGIIMGDGSSFKHTFDSQGEYEYYCTLHPWMIAKITVK